MRVIGGQSHGVRAPVVENDVRDNLGPVVLVKGSNKCDFFSISYIPEIWAIFPIAAVMSMPKQPPMITRIVGIKSFEPAVLALRMPVRTNPATVKATMLHAFSPKVGARAPRKGINPPAVKLRAEAIAA
jgi:hypothetical protein